MSTPFTKMHGLGNDFVVFDARKGTLDLPRERVRALADRHSGIGCDQLIAIEPARQGGDVFMRIWNADGGEVEACGNATRCVARLLGGHARIETLGGLLETDAEGDGAAVDMGRPAFEWDAVPLAYAMDTLAMPVGWEGLEAPVAVSVGNPHVIFFVDDLDAVPLGDIGPVVEADPLFPERVNVNVAQVLDRAHIRLKVWERGAGLTRACGTGACATAVAAMRRGLADRTVSVELPGGTLEIEWLPTGHIRMTGPAATAFRGEVDLGGVRMSVIDFGCRLNLVEGAAMRRFVPDDTLVFNTCAVTGEAVRQARQAIRRAKREHPLARIVVTGCAAQIEPDRFAAMPEVSQVLGNVEKLQAASYGGEMPVRVNDIMAVRETAGHLLDAFADHARAFVEVQNGCDHRCTFCVIPYGRGNSRSVPADLIVERIERLADKGFNEIVLTGVDVTAWGAEWGLRLGDLIQRILMGVPRLPRLRLSSLDAVEVDGALLEAIAGEARLMPHLHLSLQAGDDMVLTRMKRRHRRADAVRFVEAVKAKRDVAIGADIIAGFPTEDDAMFANSLSLIDACDVVHAHVFPYSARAGTPAARMPQVPVALRRERASRLRRAGTERRAAWLGAQVGGRQSVLVETADGLGHGEGFAPVRVPGASRGSVVSGTVVACQGGELRMAA